MRCHACKARNRRGAAFCGNCRTRLAHGVRAGPLAFSGAIVAVAGSFLPWLMLGGVTASAWDISMPGLLTGHMLGREPSAAVLVLVVFVVALPVFSGRALPPRSLLVIGALPILVAALAASRGLTAQPRLRLCAGIAVAALGGAAIMADELVTSGRRARPRRPGSTSH